MLIESDKAQRLKEDVRSNELWYVNKDPFIYYFIIQHGKTYTEKGKYVHRRAKKKRKENNRNRKYFSKIEKQIKQE